MLKQVLALLLLAVLSAAQTAQTKYYAVDQDMQVKEVPSSIFDFVLHDPKITAVSKFTDDLKNSGWVYYYYKADNSTADWRQMYLSGYLEGYAAYYLIHDSWVNMQSTFGDLPANVTDFVKEQLAYVTETAEKFVGESYWAVVNLTLAQIHGVYDGFQAALVKNDHPEYNITFDQFYLISYLTDLGDIVAKFTSKDIKYPRCSFLAKMVEDNLYVSHTTWSGYTALLRSYKVLDLDLQNPHIKTKRISYSGLPGSVVSQDDFYILDDARVVTETSLLSDNNAVYDFVRVKTVPYVFRITVANLMFDTQENWKNIFFSFRSGTYNNQWLLIDFKNFNDSRSNPSQAKNVIWMVEEFYNLTSFQDVTQELLIPQGYVASYNVPYTSAIRDLAQNPTNYTDDPRAVLFKKYAPGIQDIDDFKFVMRLNNISDTGDYCQAISSRCDLNPTTTNPWGAIDCKVTSNTLSPTHQAWVISGPTHDAEAPFSWEKWSQFNNTRNGMPTVYDFDWVFMDPNTNFSVHALEHGKLAFEGAFAWIMESNWRREEGVRIETI